MRTLNRSANVQAVETQFLIKKRPCLSPTACLCLKARLPAPVTGRESLDTGQWNEGKITYSLHFYELSTQNILF